MGLFAFSDIPSASPTKHTEPENPDSIIADGPSSHLIGTRGLKLKKALATLQPEQHLHFPSYAMWSSHEVLTALLEITGPVDLYMTSWSIAENPIRELIKLMSAGLINESTFLFHERTKANHPAAWQLASHKLKRIRLVKIHAKLMVLINDTWAISVITTANFNRNKNIERYVICSCRTVAEADAKWINDVYERGAPFS